MPQWIRLESSVTNHRPLLCVRAAVLRSTSFSFEAILPPYFSRACPASRVVDAAAGPHGADIVLERKAGVTRR